MKHTIILIAALLLTPHCASNTREASSSMVKMVVDNILAYYSGSKMVIVPEPDVLD